MYYYKLLILVSTSVKFSHNYPFGFFAFSILEPNKLTTCLKGGQLDDPDKNNGPLRKAADSEDYPCLVIIMLSMDEATLKRVLVESNALFGAEFYNQPNNAKFIKGTHTLYKNS